MENIRNIAIHLYGSGLSDNGYIAALAVDLRTSESGVRKWWYGQRHIPGAAIAALTLLEERKQETES